MDWDQDFDSDQTILNTHFRLWLTNYTHIWKTENSLKQS